MLRRIAWGCMKLGKISQSGPMLIASDNRRIQTITTAWILKSQIQSRLVKLRLDDDYEAAGTCSRSGASRDHRNHPRWSPSKPASPKRERSRGR